jgi:predicted nucleic acid-binding protein
LDLLDKHPFHAFVATNHVRERVSRHYPEHTDALGAVFCHGTLCEIELSSQDELKAYTALSNNFDLGSSECASIAAAQVHGYSIVLDDPLSHKHAEQFLSPGKVLWLRTALEDLVKHGLISALELQRILGAKLQITGGPPCPAYIVA